MPDSPVKKVNIMDGGWGGNSFFRWNSWGVAISFLLLNKTIAYSEPVCKLEATLWGRGHLSGGLIDRKGPFMGGSGRNNF